MTTSLLLELLVVEEQVQHIPHASVNACRECQGGGDCEPGPACLLRLSRPSPSGPHHPRASGPSKALGA